MTPCLDADALAKRADTNVTRILLPEELEEAGLTR